MKQPPRLLTACRSLRPSVEGPPGLPVGGVRQQLQTAGRY